MSRRPLLAAGLAAASRDHAGDHTVRQALTGALIGFGFRAARFGIGTDGASFGVGMRV